MKKILITFLLLFVSLTITAQNRLLIASQQDTLDTLIVNNYYIDNNTNTDYWRYYYSDWYYHNWYFDIWDYDWYYWHNPYYHYRPYYYKSYSYYYRYKYYNYCNWRYYPYYYKSYYYYNPFYKTYDYGKINTIKRNRKISNNHTNRRRKYKPSYIRPKKDNKYTIPTRIRKTIKQSSTIRKYERSNTHERIYKRTRSSTYRRRQYNPVRSRKYDNRVYKSVINTRSRSNHGSVKKSSRGSHSKNSSSRKRK